MPCIAGLLTFAACENTGSPTVGKYEQEETSQSTEKTENKPHGRQSKQETVTASGRDTTLQTSGDAPSGHSAREVKTDANTADTTATTHSDRP